MIQFDRLTLSGFKSFVDKTDLAIAPGLTGIVGPNGCGKSNLVEALRWAMGENSAKRMRGGDMDDVIFNGTSARPARNFAEVVINLNNGLHTAPEPYAPFDQIEISRRIERDQGSTYRINGKIARARDVSLLLADTMTGAHSPALVSQGKLTQIITAKPFDRRLILEESAGITGLHARRHEAELKLQAADQNLARLQDSLGALEQQLASLKRQSRQAEKYRSLTDAIKVLDTAIAALDYIKITRAGQSCAHDVTMIEQKVADALLAVTHLNKTLETQTADLPTLRTQAAEAAARYQAVAIELRQLELEERQLADQMTAAQAQLTQTQADIDHDTQVMADGAALLMALDDEEKQLTHEQEQETDRLPVLEDTQAAVAARLKSLEEELQTKTHALIDTRARRQNLLAQISDTQNRLAQNQARRAQTAERLAEMKSPADQKSADDMAGQISAFEERLQIFTAQITSQKSALKDGEESMTVARSVVQQEREKLARAQAEQKALQDFLASDLLTTHPILNDIQAEAGFEQALAKALGDTLFGSTDEQANIVWRRRGPLPAPSFPAGVTPIDEKIRAPIALHTALGYIGYVLDRETGDGASAFLSPGQIIVSLDGYLWRWDGLFMKPSAKDRQAMILEHKNRLTVLTEQVVELEQIVAAATETLMTSEKDMAALRAGLAAVEHDQRTTQATLNTTRQEWQKIIQSTQEKISEQARLTELLALIEQDSKEREQAWANLNIELNNLLDPDASGLAHTVAMVRDHTASTQIELRAATLATERCQQDVGRRQARLHGIADQRVALNNRTARAQDHLASLQNRLEQMHEKLTALSERPGQMTAQRNDLMSRLSTLEVNKGQAEDALQFADNEAAQTARALKDAENTLNNAREERAGHHARLTAMQERQAVIEQEILATFQIPPVALMDAAGLMFDTADDELRTIDDKRTKREKLIRDRDAMGPVNLRADVEAQEIDTHLSKVIVERDDLLKAIEELRGAISTINSEARERLTAAFDTINDHFKDLFSRLFGGGQAHLDLVQSDNDPLGAGLEIYAQPPGKTLQSISLLSGGEQSLTAAALIFAMFLTNPSPICVLDEIDAPLDDANVDRICNLLHHITSICGTRFLVVTHHRLTMARMDRLYGVTMGEKGVSQLVSVDLQQQLELLEAA